MFFISFALSFNTPKLPPYFFRSSEYAYKSSYKSDVSMPDNVKDLTKNQAMVILNEMFFRPYNINHIPDEKLASNLLKARMRHHFNFIIKKHDQINY